MVSQVGLSRNLVSRIRSRVLLAGVAFPPDGSHANMRGILHHLLVGDSGSVEHGLIQEAQEVLASWKLEFK